MCKDLSTGLPPLGLTPRFLWVEHRLDEVNRAIKRYIDAGILPLQEWLDEKIELEAWLAARRLRQQIEESRNPGVKNVD